MTVLHRCQAFAFRADPAVPDAPIEISASSEFAVQRGRFREILSHDAGAIQNIARSLLLNHDPDQIIGAIDTAGVGPDRALRAQVRFAPTPRGQEAAALVRSGALSGVSIGYSIDAYDRSESDGITTIRATRWTLREISLTPIPADPTVGVGRSSDVDGQAFAALLALPVASITPAASAPTQERTMNDPVVPAPATPAAAPITPALDLRAEAKTITSQAEALGLRASDYVGLPLSEAKDKMLGDVAAKRTSPVVPAFQVGESATMKRAKHLADELASGHLSVRDLASDLGMCGNGLRDSDMIDNIMSDLSRGMAGMGKRLGIRAKVIDGKLHLDERDLQRAAETSANFTMVAGLASTKLAFDGFTSYKPWSDNVLTKGKARDFKAIRTAALQMGDFSSPAEGSAFSDLTIDDAGGTGSLTMRGAGIELTKQALYNDELGLFLDRIQKVGYLAAQHQDKLAATAIPGATWTAATAAIALGSAGLKTAWANFMAVTGPAGEKPGYVPARLLVPSALYITALEITTLAQGATTENPLASNSSANPGKMPIQGVHGLHRSDAHDWCSLADPKEASGFTYFTHPDYDLPQFYEVDAGLVASRKWRVEYPSAIVVSHLNPGTTTKPVGAYQATQP